MLDGLNFEALLAAAVFTGARVSGLMMFCPFLGSDAVPLPVKAALTLLLTILVHPLQGPVTLAVGAWQWAQVALGEAVIGLMLGLVANFLFEAALLAGQILGCRSATRWPTSSIRRPRPTLRCCRNFTRWRRC